jgi:hypothetical protein
VGFFPFEPAGLLAGRLDPLTLPEPPRHGEDGRECARCARPDERVAWSDEHWTLSGFGEPPGVPFAAILESRAHLDLGDLDDERAPGSGRRGRFGPALGGCRSSQPRRPAARVGVWLAEQVWLTWRG